MTDWGKVAVLMGGSSAERDISLKSGIAVAAALTAQGVDVTVIDVAKDIVARLQSENYTRAFIALHGRGGEDGRIQALLEFLEIPYTGSGVAASALAMDKLLTKQLWLAEQLPTPDYCILQDTSDFAAVVEKLGLPLIVKPAEEGSSLGISRVESEQELKAAYKKAKQYASRIFAEQWIEGTEYTVAILEGEALPVIQLQTQRQFYDYQAKYISDDTQYICPCGLAIEQETACQKLALQAFSLLGCQGWGRVDFFIDNTGNIFLIEINTVPGMTDHSLVPMAAEQKGIHFADLVLAILATAQ